MSHLNGNAQAIADHIADLFNAFVADGGKRYADFIAEIEEDLAEVWTVPVERQARYLRRIELQTMALIEIQRLQIVQTTKQGLAQAISLGIKLALRALAA